VGASYSNGLRCPSVCLSVCHTRTSSKLSEIDAWLLENSNRNPGFAIQNLPSLRPFRQKWGSWLNECGNSHQSRHSTGTACFVVYIVCIVVCTASLKEGEHNHNGHLGGPAIVTSRNGRYLVIVVIRQQGNVEKGT